MELVGWPDHLKTADGNLLNLSKFPDSPALKELYHGLTHGLIHWRPLDEEEWKARKLADPSAITAPAAQTSMTGSLQPSISKRKKSGNAQGSARKKATKAPAGGRAANTEGHSDEEPEDGSSDDN